MKKLLSTALLSIFIVLGVSQAQDGIGFKNDHLYIGPTLGYTLFFSGSLGFGARAEYGVKDNWDFITPGGSLGIGAELGYSSYSNNVGYLDWKWSYTLISFMAYGSYHFTPKKAFDPYARLGLGFNNVSAKWEGVGTSELYHSNYDSGLGVMGSVGFNYHFSPNMLFRADLGWPFLLSVGLDFDLGNMGWQ